MSHPSTDPLSQERWTDEHSRRPRPELAAETPPTYLRAVIRAHLPLADDGGALDGCRCSSRLVLSSWDAYVDHLAAMVQAAAARESG